MVLFSNIKRSIYSPSFYREVLGKPLSFSFKYFYALVVIVVLVTTVFLSSLIIPRATAFLQSTAQKIVDNYPQELEVTLKDGKVTTNVQEPYMMKAPADFKDSVQKSDDKKDVENLVVIDTKTPFSVDQFRSYKTLVWLTGDSVVYEDRSKIVVQPLSGAANYTLNKEKLSGMVNKFTPLIKYLPVLIVFGLFIGLFIWLSLKLVYLLICAFIIWLIAAKFKKIAGIGYWKSYQLGLHAITLPIILDYTIFWMLPQMRFMFLFSIIMLIVVWINLKPTVVGEPVSEQPVSTSQ